MPQGSAELEYAPLPPLRQRRSFRRAMLAAGIVAIVVCGWIMLPRYWRNAQAALRDRQWMAYTRPPTRIAFEPAGLKAQELFQPGLGYIMRPGGVFHDVDVAGFPDDPLFLHARRRPDGERRLVCVSIGYESGKPIRLQFEADVLVPATVARPGWRGPTVVSSLPQDAAGKPPRIYAGQPDAADETHFTMRYEFPEARNGVLKVRNGVIHGYLRDNDTVELKVEEEPVEPKETN
jgi:hypothetical protein